MSFLTQYCTIMFFLVIYVAIMCYSYFFIFIVVFARSFNFISGSNKREKGSKGLNWFVQNMIQGLGKSLFLIYDIGRDWLCCDQPFLEAVSPELSRFIGGLKVDSGTELPRFMNRGTINYRFSPLLSSVENQCLGSWALLPRLKFRCFVS